MMRFKAGPFSAKGSPSAHFRSSVIERCFFKRLFNCDFSGSAAGFSWKAECVSMDLDGELQLHAWEPRKRFGRIFPSY